MAIYTTSLLNNSSSDANFRAWGSWISGRFAACGLVQTADTGQVNWATVTAPAGVNTSQGYEIWRFSDALQGTAPVFFKLEYGSGSGAAIPGLWITIGSGSNGTGTLTGILNVRRQVACGNSSVNLMGCYFSGDTGRFVVALFASGTGTSLTLSSLLSMERTKDGTGADTTEGVLCIWRSQPAGWCQILWNCTTGPVTAEEASLGAMGPAQGSGIAGGQIAVFPVFHSKGTFANPGLNAMAYIDATIAVYTPIAFTVYGASHTYLPLGGTAFPSTLQRNANGAIMIRWE